MAHTPFMERNIRSHCTSGVGNKRIDSAKGLHRTAKELFHLRFAGEISFDGKRFDVAQLALQRSNAAAIAMVMEHDGCAFGGECSRDGRADATGSAGDEHYFAGQFRIHPYAVKKSLRKPAVSPARHSASWSHSTEDADSIPHG